MASTSASHTNNQALLNIVLISQFSLKNTYIYICVFLYSSISHGLYALIDDNGKDVDDDDNDSD